MNPSIPPSPADRAPLKICLVVSSIGGPRMLTPLFSGHIKKDVAYIVIQRLAGAGLMDVLVECLREEVNRKTIIVGHTADLEGGVIHFLPNERNFMLQGETLVTVEVPGATRLNLDFLFNSVLHLSNPCSVVILSGMVIDSDGIEGLTKLHAKGIPILGTLESHTPVFDMIEQLQEKNLMGELYPPKYLLEHLQFKEAGDEKALRRDGSQLAPRILVADDEEKIRNSIITMLTKQKMVTDFAVDGLDALRKIQKGKYDILLLDLNMPEMDGLRTLEALKTIDPDLPIIVMTGQDDPVKIQAAKEFHLLGVVQKPFTWDKIKRLLAIKQIH